MIIYQMVQGDRAEINRLRVAVTVGKWIARLKMDAEKPLKL